MSFFETGDPRRVTSLTAPTPRQAPRVPEPPLSGRRFEVGGRELRPLAGPEIPIPPEQDEDFLARYEVWRSFTAGSLPEYIVWEFLIFRKKQVPGLDFVYQSPLLGGRTEFGGFILDFYFPLRSAGWRVQGKFYHFLTPGDRARDTISRAIFEGRGIQIIDLWDDDLLTRPIFVLEAAWEG